MAEQYTPNDEDMRWHYAVKRMHDGATRTHAEQEYTRWLAAHDACVRRDAWNEGAQAQAVTYGGQIDTGPYRCETGEQA